MEIALNIPVDQINQQQLCFIHIPKTAGTSFTEILSFIVGRENLLIILPEVMNGFEALDPNINNYACITGHFTYQIHQFLNRTPIFLTFLREPLARAVSVFQEYRRIDPFATSTQRLKEPEQYSQIRQMTLEDFANHHIFGTEINNMQTRMLGIREEFPLTSIGSMHPISWTRHDFSLDLAKERLEQFCFLGIQEKFEMSMQILAYHFRLFPISNPPKLQTSVQKSSFEDLPASVINHLIELNDLDLELYDFGLKLFQNRHAEMLSKLKSKYERKGKKLSTNELLAREFWQYPEHIRNVVYSLDNVQPRGGWYRVEESGNNKWMWSGPESLSWIELPLDRTIDLFANFHLDALTTEILESLAIYADDRQLELEMDFKDGIIFKGRIPADRQKKKFSVTRFRFQLSHTSLPPGMDSETPGARLLGISLRKIDVFPANMQKRHLLQWFRKLE